MQNVISTLLPPLRVGFPLASLQSSTLDQFDHIFSQQYPFKIPFEFSQQCFARISKIVEYLTGDRRPKELSQFPSVSSSPFPNPQNSIDKSSLPILLDLNVLYHVNHVLLEGFLTPHAHLHPSASHTHPNDSTSNDSEMTFEDILTSVQSSMSRSFRSRSRSNRRLPPRNSINPSTTNQTQRLHAQKHQHLAKFKRKREIYSTPHPHQYLLNSSAPLPNPFSQAYCYTLRVILFTTCAFQRFHSQNSSIRLRSFLLLLYLHQHFDENFSKFCLIQLPTVGKQGLFRMRASNAQQLQLLNSPLHTQHQHRTSPTPKPLSTYDIPNLVHLWLSHSFSSISSQIATSTLHQPTLTLPSLSMQQHSIMHTLQHVYSFYLQHLPSALPAFVQDTFSDEIHFARSNNINIRLDDYFHRLSLLRSRSAQVTSLVIEGREVQQKTQIEAKRKAAQPQSNIQTHEIFDFELDSAFYLAYISHRNAQLSHHFGAALNSGENDSNHHFHSDVLSDIDTNGFDAKDSHNSKQKPTPSSSSPIQPVHPPRALYDLSTPIPLQFPYYRQIFHHNTSQQEPLESHRNQNTNSPCDHYQVDYNRCLCSTCFCANSPHPPDAAIATTTSPSSLLSCPLHLKQSILSPLQTHRQEQPPHLSNQPSSTSGSSIPATNFNFNFDQFLTSQSLPHRLIVLSTYSLGIRHELYYSNLHDALQATFPSPKPTSTSSTNQHISTNPTHPSLLLSFYNQPGTSPNHTHNSNPSPHLHTNSTIQTSHDSQLQIATDLYKLYTDQFNAMMDVVVRTPYASLEPLYIDRDDLDLQGGSLDYQHHHHHSDQYDMNLHEGHLERTSNAVRILDADQHQHPNSMNLMDQADTLAGSKMDICDDFHRDDGDIEWDGTLEFDDTDDDENDPMYGISHLTFHDIGSRRTNNNDVRDGFKNDSATDILAQSNQTNAQSTILPLPSPSTYSKQAQENVNFLQRNAWSVTDFLTINLTLLNPQFLAACYKACPPAFHSTPFQFNPAQHGSNTRNELNQNDSSFNTDTQLEEITPKVQNRNHETDVPIETIYTHFSSLFQSSLEKSIEWAVQPPNITHVTYNQSRRTMQSTQTMTAFTTRTMTSPQLPQSTADHITPSHDSTQITTSEAIQFSCSLRNILLSLSHTTSIPFLLSISHHDIAVSPSRISTSTPSDTTSRTTHQRQDISQHQTSNLNQSLIPYHHGSNSTSTSTHLYHFDDMFTVEKLLFHHKSLAFDYVSAENASNPTFLHQNTSTDPRKMQILTAQQVQAQIMASRIQLNIRQLKSSARPDAPWVDAANPTNPPVPKAQKRSHSSLLPNSTPMSASASKSPPNVSGIRNNNISTRTPSDGLKDHQLWYTAIDICCDKYFAARVLSPNNIGLSAARRAAPPNKIDLSTAAVACQDTKNQNAQKEQNLQLSRYDPTLSFLVGTPLPLPPPISAAKMLSSLFPVFFITLYNQSLHNIISFTHTSSSNQLQVPQRYRRYFSHSSEKPPPSALSALSSRTTFSTIHLYHYLRQNEAIKCLFCHLSPSKGITAITATPPLKTIVQKTIQQIDPTARAALQPTFEVSGICHSISPPSTFKQQVKNTCDNVAELTNVFTSLTDALRNNYTSLSSLLPQVLYFEALPFFQLWAQRIDPVNTAPASTTTRADNTITPQSNVDNTMNIDNTIHPQSFTFSSFEFQLSSCQDQLTSVQNDVASWVQQCHIAQIELNTFINYVEAKLHPTASLPHVSSYYDHKSLTIEEQREILTKYGIVDEKSLGKCQKQHTFLSTQLNTILTLSDRLNSAQSSNVELYNRIFERYHVLDSQFAHYEQTHQQQEFTSSSTHSHPQHDATLYNTHGSTSFTIKPVDFAQLLKNQPQSSTTPTTPSGLSVTNQSLPTDADLQLIHQTILQQQDASRAALRENANSTRHTPTSSSIPQSTALLTTSNNRTTQTVQPNASAHDAQNLNTTQSFLRLPLSMLSQAEIRRRKQLQQQQEEQQQFQHQDDPLG